MDRTPPEQPLLIRAQFIKDFSFENPNAPEIYASLVEQPPQISVNIDVIPIHLSQRTYEIVFALRVKAMSGDKVAFLVELDYAAVASIGESVSEEDLERLLLSETPRHLFPFARQILASVTHDAAFPPLVINPVDFEEYFQRHKKGTLEATLKARSQAAQPERPEPAAEAEMAAPETA